MSCLLASFLASLISVGVLPEGALETEFSALTEGTCDVAPPPGDRGDSSSGDSAGGSSSPTLISSSKPGSGDRDRLYNGF